MTSKLPRPDDAAARAQIRTMLRQQDATSMVGALGRLLLGLGVCLLCGSIFAGVIHTGLLAVFGSSWIGPTGWFVVYVIILVPVLIYHERGSRESYLSNSLKDIDPNPSSRGGYEMNKGILQVAVLASVVAWGPRALIDGRRGICGLRTTAQQAVFERAAVIVVALRYAQNRVEIKELARPPEDMEIFGLWFDLLDAHGWIGRSSDGRAVWLNSTFRDKLARSL